MKNLILSLCPSFIFFLLTLSSLNAIAQWTQTGGPPGMSVNTFYQKGGNLFAGTSAKGVFKSTDHGITWTAANNGIENSDVFSLISDATYLYAGTNDGPYRSADNGATWTAANS